MSNVKRPKGTLRRLAIEAKKRMNENDYGNLAHTAPKSKLPIIEKVLREKILSVIATETESVQSPISRLIDAEQIALMSPVEQQRYILKTAELYKTLRSEYYKRSKSEVHS
ncbi:MAG: hypothetical protein LBC13_03795 [Clostridiales bacterium]|jgi:hypothetical protein|nr:hypothetical protein [Clostridiales bacterium]